VQAEQVEAVVVVGLLVQTQELLELLIQAVVAVLVQELMAAAGGSGIVIVRYAI
jgi:hypothetical protein